MSRGFLSLVLLQLCLVPAMAYTPERPLLPHESMSVVEDPDHSLTNFACSMFFFFCLLYCYFSGVIGFVKRGIWAEIVIILLIPVSLFPFVDMHDMITDRLTLLETSFNLLCLALRVCTHYGWLEKTQGLFDYLFLGWFVCQVAGFCVMQAMKGASSCIITSVMMGMGILLYFGENRIRGAGPRSNDQASHRSNGRTTVYDQKGRLLISFEENRASSRSSDRASTQSSDQASTTVFDKEGRLLIFGHDASPYLQYMYMLWFFGVAFVEYHAYPKLVVACLHLASIVMAMKSGEFFRVRILTASHSFIITFMFTRPHDPNFLGPNFVHTPAWVAIDSILPYIKWGSLVGVALLLVLYIRNLARHYVLSRSKSLGVNS